MQNLLALASKNKHTTGAGIIILVTSALEFLGPLWFPTKKHEFEETCKWITRTAAIYGLVAAGDASKSVTKEEADTKYLKKSDNP